MRVQFLMPNFGDGHFRVFQPVIREMLRRGHEVHLVRSGDQTRRGVKWLEELQSEEPGLTWATAPIEVEDQWALVRDRIHKMHDYVRYLAQGHQVDDHPLIRLARRRVPQPTVGMLDDRLGLARHRRRARVAHWALGAAVRALPAPPALRDYIEAQRPDVVLLSPSFGLGSVDQDNLRAARELGVPAVLCVTSWDNLAHRQLIGCDPDLTLVWNEIQKREAVDIHGLPPERVVTTGAQVYDQWFECSPTDRAMFCERVGLPADRSYVLYLGGALFSRVITEAQFVERWLTALRSSAHPELRDVPVLVRAHPSRIGDLRQVDLESQPSVVVWPQDNQMPVADTAKQDFYDSMYHAAAVVGINTSAMIEAGILGKRVFAILAPPEMEESQFGTLHFRYLTEAGGGLVRLAPLEEHLDDLAATVASGDNGRSGTAENRPFLEAFIRPHGLDVPATPIFVDVVERAATMRPEPLHPTRVVRVLRAAFEPFRVALELREGRKHRRHMLRARRSGSTAQL